VVRILYITPQLETGGTESHIFKLISNLDRHEFRPFILCSGLKNSKANFAQKIQVDNIPLIWVRLGLKQFYNVFKAVRYINDNNIDIIHSYSYIDVKWDVIIYLLSKSKVLITERRNLQHWRIKKSITFWEKLRNKITISIVANSTEVVKVVSSIEQIPASRIELIHNGVFFSNSGLQEVEALIKEKIKYQTGDFIISNVANLKKVKRQEDIIRALSILTDRGMKNVKLLLAGTNDQAYQGQLENLAAEYHITDKVFFLGEILTPESIYLLSSIMVLSSEAEGFSNSVIEALFFGVPVIASNVGGNLDVIKNGMNGFLYESTNAIELAESIAYYYDLSNEEKENFSKNAIETSKLFTIEKMVLKYTELYNRLI
jgi:glycosyltransferase involved in cell wall biosynthesis